MNHPKGKEQKEEDEKADDIPVKFKDSVEKNDSPQEVKSTAIVKYSAVQVPGTFARLQCNTDLNLPPSNWLSSSAESYGLQHVLSHSKGFSSFRMAHMFPDCVPEVDVVSDAENIKKLLKIPYSRDAVSMMVHCVEKTLLIDEFDIHKHLLRTSESDWEWLRKFFYEHILQSLNNKEKSFSHKNKSRYALQQKSLISKFLHHSLAESERPVEAPAPPEPKTAMTWPPLPEPPVEEELPDPATDHTFNRNVVWTFEDIQMLLGTDMPIFGGSTHPCISLRLRDMTKPISVLTGIDYWLDNLMCNVPEVVMCYHLNGIVQRYELVKTEDLPHLCDSKFSPKIIRDVAQNILSFLKSNATKAGHTYWLFKGKNEDVVKLYDLTCLCSESLVDKGQNPFTVPVAMLLYRVARNMKHSANNTTTLQPGTIRVLLKNCLNLLPKEKYPQIVTSANYMLSDLYVPVNTDPSCPCLDNEPSCKEPQEDEEEEEEEEFSNAIKTLCISDFPPNPSFKYTAPPALGGTLEDRCQQALEHVVAGLQCLQYFENQSFTAGTSHQEKRYEQDRAQSNEPQVEPKMARSFQAIPMPYEPLGDPNVRTELEAKEKTSKKKSRKKRNDSKTNVKKNHSNTDVGDGEQTSQVSSPSWKSDTSPKALLCKQRAVPLPTWQQPEHMDSAAWHAHLKTLLYEKACLVYTTLAERAYATKKFGRAMSYIKYVLHCHTHMARASGRQNNIEQPPAKGLISYLLGRAGDCCIQLAQCWEEVAVHREDFALVTSVDEALEVEMDKDLPENDYPDECKLVPDFISSIEQILHASYNCYQQALMTEPSDNIRRRIGNVHNELGAFYMNQIALGQGPDGEIYDAEQFDILFKTAQQHLDKGQAQFEAANDGPNLALLLSNHGRLMRLLAHYHHPLDRKDVSPLEKQFYNKALDCYKKALNVLKNRKGNPLVWDSIMWEMSTTLYTMATLYQDYPPAVSESKSQEDCEREVLELLMKALQSCDLDTQSFRLPIYQYRAATLNYRLGSLYHNSYRNLHLEDSRRKSFLHLAQLHYERSCHYMEMLEHPVDYLRMQLERVALQEYVAEFSGINAKIKALQSALEILIKSRPIIVVLAEQQETRHKRNINNTKSEEGQGDEKEADNSSENIEVEKEEADLLILFEKRLQFVLRSLCLLCQQHKSASLPRYKEMYSLVLKQRDDKGLTEHLKTVLTRFEELLNKSR